MPSFCLHIPIRTHLGKDIRWSGQNNPGQFSSSKWTPGALFTQWPFVPHSRESDGAGLGEAQKSVFLISVRGVSETGVSCPKSHCKKHPMRMLLWFSRPWALCKEGWSPLRDGGSYDRSAHCLEFLGPGTGKINAGDYLSWKENSESKEKTKDAGVGRTECGGAQPTENADYLRGTLGSPAESYQYLCGGPGNGHEKRREGTGPKWCLSYRSDWKTSNSWTSGRILRRVSPQ